MHGVLGEDTLSKPLQAAPRYCEWDSLLVFLSRMRLPGAVDSDLKEISGIPFISSSPLGREG